MLKQIIVIVVLCLLAISCVGSGSIKKPDNLIPKDKMSDILYDLYVINAAKGVNRKLLEKNGFVPETYVLTKYNIDSTQFADSNTYYAFHTETYSAIVEKVKARLEKEKEIYDKFREAERVKVKARRDSIKEIREERKDSIIKSSKKKSNTIKKIFLNDSVN